MHFTLEDYEKDIPEKSVAEHVDEIAITKYVKKNGKYNISDRHLAGIYRRTVKEKTVHKVFFDMQVRNTNDFINYFKDENLEFFIVSYHGQESGFYWLKEFAPRASFITYCLYKSFWGEHTLKISQACIEATFNKKDEHGNHKTDILLGLTPASNKLALKFLAKNGMKIVGSIPNLIRDAQKGKLVDGIISYRHRENGNANRSFLSLFSMK